MAKNTVSQIHEIGRNVERLAGKKVMDDSEQITASSKPEKVAHWVKARWRGLTTSLTRRRETKSC